MGNVTQYLRVNNWKKHQHYKDRNPPWIKLSRDLLNDYDFTCLQDASKLHLMLIWLLASQMDNKIPADSDFIKGRINVSGDIDFKELIDNGFLVDDSGVLADCTQVDVVETETETETETERVTAKSLVPSRTEKLEAFEAWYSRYPLKKGRKQAEKAWDKLTPDEMQRCIDVVNNPDFDAHMSKMVRGTKDFRKHPSTWLNGGCWEDEMVQSYKSQNGDPF